MFVNLYGHSYHRIKLPNHKFEVFKYTHPFVLKNKVVENDFDTNQLKIAYATARTLCSFHLDNKELYFDLIASLLSHLNFITKDKQDYLQIFESRYVRLRDFSKTTRIGELAQGVNYLFTQERLDYPYVVDFHLFHLKVYGTPYPKRSSPDFFVLKEDFSEIGLMESKGEGAKRNSISGKLQSALKQLENVKKPCVDALMPMCSRFEWETTGKKSSINYAFIKKDCKTKDNFKLRILRLHYASWFYLVGDFNRVEQLLNIEGFDDLEGDVNYILDTTDKESPIYWVERARSFGFSKQFNIHVDMLTSTEFKIGIYKKVIERILSNTTSVQTNFSSESDTEFERFRDGTVIKIGDKK
ncbi:hypothetical protein [uncultured Lacinutrix sp.]|uniref:hypothetical protein n=1 Tax=uncultured Lacinutrix sp. TaxID=574032 RepID=UPI00261E9A88|nr:hypothetical protein [uncultured Lacinutrix sp.]